MFLRALLVIIVMSCALLAACSTTCDSCSGRYFNTCYFLAEDGQKHRYRVDCDAWCKVRNYRSGHCTSALDREPRCVTEIRPSYNSRSDVPPEHAIPYDCIWEGIGTGCACD